MNTSESTILPAPLVFITGASSGIGQALAARFARAGYRLALVARRTADMQAWADGQGLDAARCRVYGADVADTDSIVAAGQACLAAQGLPDVVIANAGISVGMDTAERDDIDVMARTFATNNTGLAATFHPFVTAMTARGSGALVGIGSVAAIRGLPGHGAYCASKAAVVAYCESLRGELRGSGVSVVTVLPGYVDTPLQHAVSAERRHLRGPCVRRHPGARQLPRHSLADGRGGQAAARAAQRLVRPAARRAPAQTPPGHGRFARLSGSPLWRAHEKSPGAGPQGFWVVLTGDRRRVRPTGAGDQ
jgi:short-subunit dehydrogenase